MFASLLTRQIFADAQLSFVVLNCVVIGAVEILARLCIFWLNVFARGTELQRINTLTLDELLLLHDRMRVGSMCTVVTCRPTRSAKLQSASLSPCIVCACPSGW